MSPRARYALLAAVGAGSIALGAQVTVPMVPVPMTLQTLAVIAHDIDQLREVKGIGAKRLASIRQAWAEQDDVRQLMLFLQTHDIPTGKALKIFKRYGHDAIAVLRRNPYRLASDITGIGFKTADRMARQMGFPNDSPLRVAAGVLYLLREFSDQGNVFAPRQDLEKRAVDLLAVSNIERIDGQQKTSRESREPVGHL